MNNDDGPMWMELLIVIGNVAKVVPCNWIFSNAVQPSSCVGIVAVVVAIAVIDVPLKKKSAFLSSSRIPFFWFPYSK